MADEPNKPRPASDNPRPGRGSARAAHLAKYAEPEVPPSKALQWFLFAAFVISGAAYVVNEWTELTASETQVRFQSKLRRLAQNQSEYLSHFQAGDKAFAKKQYDQAVSEYRLPCKVRTTPRASSLSAWRCSRQAIPRRPSPNSGKRCGSILDW